MHSLTVMAKIKKEKNRDTKKNKKKCWIRQGPSLEEGRKVGRISGQVRVGGVKPLFMLVHTPNLRSD